MGRSTGVPLLLWLAAALLAPAAPARGVTSATLTVTPSGSGAGAVTSAPSGIDCGLTCSAAFPGGTIVDLTPAAATGSTFAGWSGGGCTGTGVCEITLDADTVVVATFDPSYRPDAWLKLCGAGDTCTHARPHPYRGEDVFNTTGALQTVAAGVEEGNNIRYWIKIENDGALGDTIYVHGCSGNSAYVIKSVSIGALTYPQPAPHVTWAFKHGTANFAFLPEPAQQDVILTLNIYAKTTIQGTRYTCPIVIHSAADPTIKDKVIAKMVTT